MYFCAHSCYLRFLGHELAGDEGLVAEMRLVKSIINKLIKDGVLLVVEDAPDGNAENRILTVHPNHHVES